MQQKQLYTINCIDEWSIYSVLQTYFYVFIAKHKAVLKSNYTKSCVKIKSNNSTRKPPPDYNS